MKLGKALATGVAEEQPQIQHDGPEVSVEAAELSAAPSDVVAAEEVPVAR